MSKKRKSKKGFHSDAWKRVEGTDVEYYHVAGEWMIRRLGRGSYRPIYIGPPRMREYQLFSCSTLAHAKKTAEDRIKAPTSDYTPRVRAEAALEKNDIATAFKCLLDHIDFRCGDLQAEIEDELQRKLESLEFRVS